MRFLLEEKNTEIEIVFAKNEDPILLTIKRAFEGLLKEGDFEKFDEWVKEEFGGVYLELVHLRFLFCLTF